MMRRKMAGNKTMIRTQTKKRLALALTAAMVLGLTACGGDPGNAGGTGAAAQGAQNQVVESAQEKGSYAVEATEEGKTAFPERTARMEAGELIVAIGEEPAEGFDPSTGGHGSITRLFFSTLFKRDKTLGWTGDLATGYEVSEDKLTWTVKIRDDAYFTNGEKLTAKDVAFTYMAAKEAGGDFDLTIVESVDVIDDTTVAFHVSRPYSVFQEKLGALGIVPASSYDEAFKDAPIGSGPFEFVQWDKGQQVIARANENYYEGKAGLNKLTLVFLDTDTAFAAVKNGSVDVAYINGTLAGRKVDGAGIINIQSIECYGICFPMVPAEGKLALDGAEIGNDVTSDIAIRKAFNRAVDRQRVVDGVLGGYGSVSTTGLEAMPWLNAETVLDPSDYGDIEGAKAILSEGGWEDTNGDGTVDKNGVEAAFDLLYTSGMYRQEMALEFVNVGKQIGVDVTLKQVTWDTILPVIHTSAVMYGFGSGDPSELYNLYYGGMAGGQVPWNNGGVYSNPEADREIDAALNAVDENDAIPHWQAMQNYASATGDAPFCWLANANHVYLAAEGFSFGQPVVQPHGGRIFDNVTEWHWQ